MGMTRRTMKDRCLYVFLEVVFNMKDMGRKIRLGKSKKKMCFFKEVKGCHV